MGASVQNNPIDTFARFMQRKCAKNMDDINARLTPSEIKTLQKSVDKAMDITELSKKGIELIHISDNNKFAHAQEIVKDIAKNAQKKIFKPSADKLRKLQEGAIAALEDIAKGNNAAYIPLAKKIVMPEEKLALSAFHEMGHALNANKSKFGKMLQGARGATLFVPVLGFLMSKSVVRDKNGNLKESFFNKHAGKLAFLSFLPMLLEEGLASIKGGKLAKQVVSKDILKSVNKTNALGFVTYLISALATTATFAIIAKMNREEDKMRYNMGGNTNSLAQVSGKRFV